MISIKETRKIMEKDGEKYSNKELEEFRDGAYILADIFIEGVLDKEENSKNR